MLPPLRLCHTSPVSPGALPLQVGKQPQPSTQHLLQADTRWCSMRSVVPALQTGKVVGSFAKGLLAGPQPASHYLEAKPHESWNRAPEDLCPLPQPLHGGIGGDGWKLTSKRDLVPPCPCPPAQTQAALGGPCSAPPAHQLGGERGRVLFAPPASLWLALRGQWGQCPWSLFPAMSPAAREGQVHLLEAFLPPPLGGLGRGAADVSPLKPRVSPVSDAVPSVLPVFLKSSGSSDGVDAPVGILALS